jgi:hypothetical protein
VVDDVLPTAFDVVEKGIYYLERVAGEGRLKYFDFASSTSSLVARNLGAIFSGGLSATRDGRVIFFTRTDSTVDDLMLVENFR